MLPMLKWRHGEDGHMGDCYRTCIANYLGIDRDLVPHFVEEHGGPDGEDGESVQNAIREWLDRRGLLFLEVALNSTLTVEEAATIGAHWLGAIDRVMVGGESVNGTNHIVLWERVRFGERSRRVRPFSCRAAVRWSVVGHGDCAVLGESVMAEKENAHCYGCDGKGWFCDSTYDRSGVNVSCKACYGTGLPG